MHPAQGVGEVGVKGVSSLEFHLAWLLSRPLEATTPQLTGIEILGGEAALLESQALLAGGG